MIYDLDGSPLDIKIRRLMEGLNKKSYYPLDIQLLKILILFYKVGLGLDKFQRQIRQEEFPIGYEILSSFVLDRFLSKYYRHLNPKIKALLLKTVELYPQYRYMADMKPLENIPEKVNFLDETADLLEDLTLMYLGFKPLCKIILKKEWDKIVFIRWYIRTLSDNSISIYSKHRTYVDKNKKGLLNLLIELEDSFETN